MADGHTPAAPSTGGNSPLNPNAPDVAAALQGALGSAYRIERELGGGGMSRVFLATETALRRRSSSSCSGEEVLRVPYDLTGARLGIDPTWKSLRGNPRSERLVRG